MADNATQTEKRFDESGALITDPNFEGESRSFDELTEDERDTYVQGRKDEVVKLDKIIERKGAKVEALNKTINDDDGDDGESGDGQAGDNNGSNDGDDFTKSISERQDRIELKQEGYADEVIDKIMEAGGKEALNNPLMKQAADNMQSEHEANNAADIGDGPQGQTQTKYSKEDLENMSSDEMEKVLPHADK